ncbi:MAG: GNAT family N-acetyltransferase [Lachnospiraceae bacterium]|nr:GNAT family N-acetyltransferase [Lachnospiraceae bacterium]
MLLDTIFLLIEKYNPGEDRESCIKGLTDQGLKVFVSREDLAGKDVRNTFVFTDSRETADEVKKEGFGFASYYSENSREEMFSDCLYNVDCIGMLSAMQINRMLLRFLGIPWVILETDRCLVREIKEDDVETLYRIFDRKQSDASLPASKDEADDGLYDDPLREEAYTRDYIKYQYRFFEYGIWIVVDKGTKRIIGRAGLSNREGFDDIELGYAIAPPYRRQGYAKEVCEGIIRYAADYMKLERLNAFAGTDNAASIGLLEKLGFEYVKDIVTENKRTLRMYFKSLNDHREDLQADPG